MQALGCVDGAQQAPGLWGEQPQNGSPGKNAALDDMRDVGGDDAKLEGVGHAIDPCGEFWRIHNQGKGAGFF